MIPSERVGIVGYGAYVPRYRIKVEEIAAVWGDDVDSIKSGLMIEEKSVPSETEDSATIAVEAAKNAVARAGIDPKDIGAIYVGSESPPYAVKPTATIVAAAIGATPDLTAADYEFACKAGTAAIQTCAGLVASSMIKYGLAIGADTAQGAPGDPLEYTAAAGGAAFVIGKKKLIAEMEGTYSYTTDTPDFWRREGQPYPRHGGRFTGAPAYFKHIIGAARGLMEELDLSPEDFDYAVFHQPNGKFPRKVARSLGFDPEQVEPTIVVDRVGNTYSGSSLLGFTAALDRAEPGDRILVVSYGSGAGSDAFSFVVTERIEEVREKAPLLEEYLEDRVYVTYGEYAKMKRKLKF
ncbi:MULTISPECIES: hydroxymethylglutaryl-CoA synthase [unclassified Methanopyrus]|uniref:hydroxymethylglutaryl-CoA synthase n=1 Tax=Methanopyrus sp. SNP6 TaxID=1937005 RepID=UPI0011E59C38|nr:hydroxymethylglutaryl-CoA synthase [Methanopyrus sp. SNP6]